MKDGVRARTGRDSACLRFVEHQQPVVVPWGEEDEEGQLCSAAFSCSACRARGVSGSWLPELRVLCQKIPPHLGKGNGTVLLGLPMELGGLQGGFNRCREKGRDGPSSEAAFLLRHISQGRDGANRAAVNQGHVFLSGLHSQATGQQRKESQQAPEPNRLTVWWTERTRDVL